MKSLDKHCQTQRYINNPAGLRIISSGQIVAPKLQHFQELHEEFYGIRNINYGKGSSD